MYTLDEFLAKPHSHLKHFGGNYTIDAFGELPVFEYEGRTTTPQEIFNLITHLSVHEQWVRIVPQAWRDDIFVAMLRHVLQQGHVVRELQLADHMAGPKSLPYLRQLAESIDLGYSLPDVCYALWRLEGLAVLPLIARAVSQRGVYFKEPLLAFLQAERIKLGISEPAWDLLFVSSTALAADKIKKTRRDSAAKLANFMEREIRFTAAELKLLASHPAHEENLRGLVFAVYSAEGAILRTFALPGPLTLAEGESIAIAHAAALDPAQIDYWKSVFAKEGRRAPFEQWKAAQEANLDDLAVEPCHLLLTLEAKGWTRCRPDPDGVIRGHFKRFPDAGLRAAIEYSGVPVKYGATWSPQTVKRCFFLRDPSGVVLADADVSPIVRNAVAADLASLREKSR